MPHPPQKTVAALGGVGVITERDLGGLAEGAKRVARLMADGRRHTREEINAAAQQAEGTRRLRELRDIPGVAVRCARVGAGRVFEYWLERMVGSPGRGGQS